ncbi:MAG: hypothetical protein AB7S38_05790 [Vulcanimicrobiota bacterium]
MSYRGKAAFALAEVMAALLVVSIALFALIALQIYALRSQQGASERHTASVLASSLIDEAINTLETDFAADVDQARQAASVTGFEYERTAEPDPASALLKQLEVIVYWTDRDGEHHYTVSTKVVKK